MAGFGAPAKLYILFFFSQYGFGNGSTAHPHFLEMVNSGAYPAHLTVTHFFVLLMTDHANEP